MKAVPGSCHALTGKRHGQFSISLDGPYRLVFEPDHDLVPTLDDGGIDRTAVTQVMIVEVIDYHDE